MARQGTSAVAYEDDDIDANDPLLNFEPFIHAAPRANSILPDVQRRFVAELRACGVVKQAARKVGKSIEALYKLRERPGAEGFAEAWDTARERFGERLHDFASARVMEGDERPIVSQGKILGWHTVYDYPTIRFMLRYNSPARYSPAAEELKPGHPAYDNLADAMLKIYNRKLRQAQRDVTPQAMAFHTYRRLRRWRGREKLIALGYDPDDPKLNRDPWDETEEDGTPCLPRGGWLVDERREEAERFLAELEDTDPAKQQAKG